MISCPVRCFRFVVLAVLCLCPSPCLADLNISDPKGDDVGVHDINTLSGTVSGGNFFVTLSFFNTIADPSVTGGSPNDLFGFVDFDTDGMVATGFSATDLLGSRGNAGVPGLGVDYYLDLSSVLVDPAGKVDLISAARPTTQEDIVFNPDQQSVTVTISLADLGGSIDLTKLYAAAIAVDGGLPDGSPFVSDTATNFTFAAVPEPSGVTKFGSGLLALAVFGLSRRFGRQSVGIGASRGPRDLLGGYTTQVK